MKNKLKKIFVSVLSFFLNVLPVPEKLRDFLMWPLSSRLLGMYYNEPIALAAGFTLHSHMEDQLGRLAMFYGRSYPYFWEPVTTLLVEELLANGNQAILAGSHVGLMALYAKKAVTSQGSVHTFEPIKHLFEISKLNFALNQDLGKITITHAALGAEPATLTMTSQNLRSKVVEAGSTDETTEEVVVTTIDTYCQEKNITSLDLVLLDVEGYELPALKGMQQLLSQKPPRDLIYEISFPSKSGLESAKAIQDFLTPFGYRFYIIEDVYDVTELKSKIPETKLTPATAEAYEAHRNHQYFNMFATLRSAEEIANL